MQPQLHPHERYIVVRAKQGWSVNLGADTLQVFGTREEARLAADRRVEEARAAGRSADWVDTADGSPM